MATPLTIQQVPIDQLRPDPANPRRIGEDELDALERSICQFGFVQPAWSDGRTAPSSVAISVSLRRDALGTPRCRSPGSIYL
jgi:hypothetical protein